MTDSPVVPVRVRNARGDGARLREEIVAAATSLLESGTAESVTLRAIAREAGITAPSIYRHFDSVDAVLRAVVEATFADLEAVLRAATTGGSAVERLRRVADSYLDFARDRPQQYRLLFGGAWNAEVLLGPGDDAERRDRSEIGSEAFRIMVAAIAACVEQGSSSSQDPVADAAALWVALHGLADLRRTTPLFPWPPTIDDELVRSLARLSTA